MEYRTLELRVLSASDLPKVNLISKMDPYVVVYLTRAGGNYPSAVYGYKQKTPISRDGDTNPNWNYPIKLVFNEIEARSGQPLTLVFQIICSRSLGDKLIGEVHVPIKELLLSDSNNDGDSKSKPPKPKPETSAVQFVSYQLRRPSGKTKGVFNFSYKLGDYVKSTADQAPPVTAYPVPPAVAVAGPSVVYPPLPPPAYGYPSTPPPPPQYGGCPPTAYPAQTRYGYGQYGYGSGNGYGCPPVVQPAPKRNNNNFGMGLGAGLLGGALAGLVVGDLVSDIAYDSYDPGFDPSFDPGFGF